MPPTSGVRPAADATGTLSGVPLAHLLVYVRNKRLTGVLELRASTARHAWLVLWRGGVVSSMTTPTVARFGTVVYELGFIDAETLDTSTLASAAAKRPQMDLLLECGAITKAQRDEVLVEQVRRRVLHLFTLPASTTFTFREGRASTTEPGVVVDLLAPIWRGVRDFPPDARAADVLRRVGAHPLRLVSEAAIERGDLEPEELALCEALRTKPMTLVHMRHLSKLPAARVDLLAYLLVISRCVEVEGAEQAPLPSGAMWAAASTVSAPTGEATAPARTSTERLTAAAPPPPSPGPAELGGAAIRRRAAGIATETPFSMLGLAEGASSEAARAAFFRISKLWHPDRLPAGLDEVRADVEHIFAHMTQAHRLLTDPAARPAVVSRNTR